MLSYCQCSVCDRWSCDGVKWTDHKPVWLTKGMVYTYTICPGCAGVAPRDPTHPTLSGYGVLITEQERRILAHTASYIDITH
jgi:hypothetical protein